MSYYTGKKELQKMINEIQNKTIARPENSPIEVKVYINTYNTALNDAIKIIKKYISHNCKITY